MLSIRAFLLVGIICSATTSSFAADSFGIFMAVKGDVKIETNGKKSAAKVREKVFQDSSVETGPDGRAKIVMSDRSVVHISPDSKVKIAKYSDKDGAKNVELSLSKGKVRNEVKGAYGESNKYEVKTPTAVAGVRGTDFIVDHNIKTNTTEVKTMEGTVAFQALKNNVATGAITLVNKNQKTTAAPDRAVEAPKLMPPEEVKTLDSESRVGDGSAASGTTGSGSGSASSSNGQKSESSSTPANEGTKGTTRIGDNTDMKPENIEKQVPTTGAPAPMPVANPGAFIPKGPNTRTNDAIRDKTDKTRVIIKPETTTPNAGSNR